MHVERGMIRREVQRKEIAFFVLDFRSERHRESELAEDRDDLVNDDADRMARTAPRRASRHGEVDVTLTRIASAAGQLGTPRGERCLELDLDGVECGAALTLLFNGERGERLELVGQRPLLAAENCDLLDLEGIGASSCATATRR